MDVEEEIQMLSDDSEEETKKTLTNTDPSSAFGIGMGADS